MDLPQTPRPLRERLVQVAADVNTVATLEREIRALQSASQHYPRAALHLVALSSETAGAIPESIHFHNAAVWLLQPWLE